MDGADRPSGGQQHDQSLNLAPVAKADRIAQIAAAFSARGRLKARIVAELRDQTSGSIKRCAIMDIRGLGRGIVGRIVKRKGHARVDSVQSWRDDYGQW